MDYHEMTSLLIFLMLGGLRREEGGSKILYYNILTHPDSDLAVK